MSKYTNQSLTRKVDDLSRGSREKTSVSELLTVGGFSSTATGYTDHCTLFWIDRPLRLTHAYVKTDGTGVLRLYKQGRVLDPTDNSLGLPYEYELLLGPLSPLDAVYASYSGDHVFVTKEKILSVGMYLVCLTLASSASSVYKGSPVGVTAGRVSDSLVHGDILKTDNNIWIEGPTALGVSFMSEKVLKKFFSINNL